MQKEYSSLTSLLGSLTAYIAIISGLIYYLGYLYLLGYYRTFGIQLETLNLSITDIMSAGGTPIVFILTILFFVLIQLSLIYRLIKKRTPITSDLSNLIKRPYTTLVMVLFMGISAITTPLMGQYVSVGITENQFIGYGFVLLSKPLPRAMVYSKEPLLTLQGNETLANGIYSYDDLLLIATNDDYFFVLGKDKTTYLIPKDKVEIALSK